MQIAIPKATAAKIAPPSIYGHSTVRIGNKFFIVGGYKDKDILDDCLSNNKIYQVMLIDDCNIHHIEFSLKFHIATVHWSLPKCYGTMPSPRAYHSVVRYGTKFIMFGGYDGNVYNCDLYVFDVGM